MSKLKKLVYKVLESGSYSSHYPRPYFIQPEIKCKRSDGSEYCLNRHIAYGTQGDLQYTFDLLDSYDETVDEYLVTAANSAERLAKAVIVLSNALEKISSGYDYCEDDHKYNNGACRTCNAQEALAEAERIASEK